MSLELAILEGEGQKRVDGAEALTFDTVVGAVRCCPTRAALSPADIPPVGSAKPGQHKGAQRGPIPRAPWDGATLYGRGHGEHCHAGQTCSRASVWPLGQELCNPADLTLSPDGHFLRDLAQPHSLHQYDAGN